MPESDIASAVRTRPTSRILDWLALLGVAFLLASHLFQPDAEPRQSQGSPALCIYTALGDVAACGTAADDDADDPEPER